MMILMPSTLPMFIMVRFLKKTKKKKTLALRENNSQLDSYSSSVSRGGGRRKRMSRFLGWIL